MDVDDFKREIAHQKRENARQKEEIARQKEEIARQKEESARQKEELEHLTKRNVRLTEALSGSRKHKRKKLTSDNVLVSTCAVHTVLFRKMSDQRN